MTAEEFNDFFFQTIYNAKWTHWNFGYDGTIHFSESDKKLIAHIKEEAIEYFSDFGLKHTNVRCRLTPDEKERVYGFMKERLKYWNEQGFIL